MIAIRGLVQRGLVVALVVSLLALGGAALPARAEGLLPAPVDVGSRLVEFDLPDTSSLPTDVVAGADDTVWVSLLGDRSVLRLDRDGEVVETIAVSGPVTAMSSDGSGGAWGTELTSNSIVHLQPGRKAVEYSIPTPNSFPADIWDGGDQVYFTESGTGAVGRLTESTGVIDEWPVAGAGSLSSISGDGQFVVVTDASAGTIWILDRDGAAKPACRVADVRDIRVVASNREQVALTSMDGASIRTINCYFAGTVYTGRVLSEGRAGLSAFATVDYYTTWFVDAARNSIGRAGDSKEFALTSARGDATGLALTEGRFLWTAEKSAGKLARFDTVASIEVERVSGRDRYETAAVIAQGARSTETAFVVSGEKFADAVSAGPVARSNSSPVLLTAAGALPAATRAALQAKPFLHVVIVGGPASVSPAVAAEIAATAPGAKVERIGGADRYAVSRALVTSTWANVYPMLTIADGRNFPDALSSAPFAAGRLLLVDGGATALTPAEMSIVKATTGTNARVRIVGGPASVNTRLEAQIAAEVRTERIGGADRYEVSSALAKAVYPGITSVFTAYLASGETYPDALAAGARRESAGYEAPLLLARSTCVPDGVLATLAALNVRKVVLFGGTSTLNDDVGALRSC